MGVDDLTPPEWYDLYAIFRRSDRWSSGRWSSGRWSSGRGSSGRGSSSRGSSGRGSSSRGSSSSHGSRSLVRSDLLPCIWKTSTAASSATISTVSLIPTPVLSSSTSTSCISSFSGVQKGYDESRQQCQGEQFPHRDRWLCRESVKASMIAMGSEVRW